MKKLTLILSFFLASGVAAEDERYCYTNENGYRFCESDSGDDYCYEVDGSIYCDDGNTYCYENDGIVYCDD